MEDVKLVCVIVRALSTKKIVQVHLFLYYNKSFEFLIFECICSQIFLIQTYLNATNKNSLFLINKLLL